ncbi:hypothetical protein [Citrobacter amalonaticus]|nr:hypothetical protein [Citrobacter amalonaticus]
MNRNNVVYICDSAKKILNEQALRYPDSDFFFPNKNYEKQLKIYNSQIKADALKRALKPTVELSSFYWSAPVNSFAKKHVESVFSLRDIRRTFKTLSGMLHFTENEKEIINQHANSSIGKKHYDRYDYIIEKKRGNVEMGKSVTDSTIKKWAK